MSRMNNRLRRGVGVVELAVVLALIAGVVVVSVIWLGTSTSSHLNQTADEIGNPALRTQRFQTAPSGTDDGSTDDGTDSDPYR